MRVTVHQDMCVGAGQCVFAAPEVFDQRDEDGIVVLLNASPPEEMREATTDAAHVCPALAIVVED